MLEHSWKPTQTICWCGKRLKFTLWFLFLSAFRGSTSHAVCMRTTWSSSLYFKRWSRRTWAPTAFTLEMVQTATAVFWVRPCGHKERTTYVWQRTQSDLCLFLLTFREVFTVAQIYRSTLQKPRGTIKELQHPSAADPGGRVWPRCWQLCWQWRHSAPLGLWDHIMPWRSRTGLHWPVLRTWTVGRPLQQAVCGLSVQWYDDTRIKMPRVAYNDHKAITQYALIPRYRTSRSGCHRLAPSVSLHPSLLRPSSRHWGHDHCDWSQQRRVLYAAQWIIQPWNHNWTSARVCRLRLRWNIHWFPTSFLWGDGVQSRQSSEHRVTLPTRRYTPPECTVINCERDFRNPRLSKWILHRVEEFSPRVLESVTTLHLYPTKYRANHCTTVI